MRKHRAILYFQDESNITLAPILARTWAPRGKTPIQEATGNRGGVSAMSAISNNSSLVFRLHTRRIASPEIIEFLQQILEPPRQAPHCCDNGSSVVPCFKNDHKLYQKSKTSSCFSFAALSPDFNPDEDVWNHLKHQELKSHKAKTNLSLEILTNIKLHEMASNKQLLRGIFFRCFVADLLN